MLSRNKMFPSVYTLTASNVSENHTRGYVPYALKTH